MKQKITFALRALPFLLMVTALTSCGAKHFKRGFAEGFASGASETSVECKRQIGNVGNVCREKVIQLSKEKQQLANECMAHDNMISANGKKLDCVEVK